MAEKWKIEGDYFESCNCDTICACLIQNPPPVGGVTRPWRFMSIRGAMARRASAV